MTRLLIRVEGEISDELGDVFPHLTRRTQRAQTTMVGELTDQEELQGILNLLHSLGVTVIDVVTIPEE